MAKATEAKLRANAKYLSRQREIKIRLDPEKDAEIIDWLEKQPSKQAYIKALIREDMELARMTGDEDYAALEEEREEKEREEEEREKALRQDAIITEVLDEVHKEMADERPHVHRAGYVMPWEDPLEDPEENPLYKGYDPALLYEDDPMQDEKVREDMARDYLARQQDF